MSSSLPLLFRNFSKTCLKYKFASRVKGLPTRKKYKFRVLAENLAGPGKPSKETDQLLIKDPIGRINVL